MLIRNKKMFGMGALFAVTFLGVLALIFSPIFSGKNGLQFADASFNSLAKGSSYFIPKVNASVEKMVGKPFSASLSMDNAEEANKAAKIYTAAGATTTVTGSVLNISGDLGNTLKSAVADSDMMYKNNGAEVAAKYGMEEKAAMKSWWASLKMIEKNMKKDKMIGEAKVVGEVMKKAVEPGYNFYKIESVKVSDKAVLMTGLLVFYVFYTMWWGYAIFYMFDGLGLSMKKSKVKKEA